ncbi:MAG TPA: NAD-binding protein, partial [Myxococcaceae bacterium]|nr:NAD-binding protein [Myxococcaceae bacterium]
MSVNLHLVLRQPLLVLGSVLGLVAVKASVLYALGRLNGLNRHSSMGLGAIASQGGEFAFVLFSLAVGARVMDRDLVELLVVVVSLSMAVTPVLFTLQERWVKAHQKQVEAKDYDGSLKDETPVIIAGFGRFGQVVGRVLRAKHIRFTALDASAEHIDFVQKFGNKVYYGDASRLELLHAAQADKARIFVLAIDDMEASLKTAALVKKHFPHLALYARARNRQHTYRLMELGVTHIFRETFPSSLELTGEVLRGLGYSFHESKSVVGRFREHDEALLARTFGIHQDMDKLQELAAKAFTELEEIFNGDVQRDRDKAA